MDKVKVVHASNTKLRQSTCRQLSLAVNNRTAVRGATCVTLNSRSFKVEQKSTRKLKIKRLCKIFIHVRATLLWPTSRGICSYM